jgi:hypothetical protein
MTSPFSLIRLAEPTGLEPATSDVTGSELCSSFQQLSFIINNLVRQEAT